MTIGSKIKQARKQAGLTQAQLAEKMGISYAGVAQWETDARNPKLSTLAKIALALGITVNDLLDGDWSGIDMSDPFADELTNTKDSLDARLRKAYSELNEAGQEKAVERVEELTEIPKYRK